VTRRGGTTWAAVQCRTEAWRGNAAWRGGAEHPGVGFLDCGRRRGDLWTTPREETRLCGRVARTETRRESRRQGQEGRARRYESYAAQTGRGSSRARARRRAPRSRRAAVNGQGAATSIGVLPPAGGICRLWRRGADHAPARERGIDGGGSLPRQLIAVLRGERRRTANGCAPKGVAPEVVPPLKTRRTTSPSVEPQLWRRKATRRGEA
jgi:hypothetical protein